MRKNMISPQAPTEDSPGVKQDGMAPFSGDSAYFRAGFGLQSARWHQKRSLRGMHYRSEQSTTLVETLISAAILMIVIGGMLYAAIAA
jgi:hypothetical protein